MGHGTLVEIIDELNTASKSKYFVTIVATYGQAHLLQE